MDTNDGCSEIELAFKLSRIHVVDIKEILLFFQCHKFVLDGISPGYCLLKSNEFIFSEWKNFDECLSDIKRINDKNSNIDTFGINLESSCNFKKISLTFDLKHKVFSYMTTESNVMFNKKINIKRLINFTNLGNEIANRLTSIRILSWKCHQTGFDYSNDVNFIPFSKGDKYPEKELEKVVIYYS